MKRIGFILVLMLASGCTTSPSMASAQRQFCKEHPGAEILAQTANDESRHTGYWPHSTTSHYADYMFRYRGADGLEHEVAWHYKDAGHGWSVEKEQTK